MEKQNTAALVKLARQKDDGAIAALYEQNYSAVYFSIKAKLSDEDTVQDLTQDAFLQAFDALDRLSDPEKFTPWVKTIGNNLALMYLRKKKPTLFSELQPEEGEEERELTFTDSSPDASPEICLDRKETSRLIQEILGTLSESQRLAIGLFYYDQLSIREISEQTGISEGSIKVHLSNGRKRIEEKVRALEKQGTRLYSFAPLPFLLWLLKAEAAGGAVIPAFSALGTAGAGTAAAITTSSSGSAGAAAGSSAAAAGAGSSTSAGTGLASKVAGMSLGSKIAAGVTAAAVLVGAPIAVAEISDAKLREYYRGYFQSEDCVYDGTGWNYTHTEIRSSRVQSNTYRWEENTLVLSSSSGDGDQSDCAVWVEDGNVLLQFAIWQPEENAAVFYSYSHSLQAGEQSPLEEMLFVRPPTIEYIRANYSPGDYRSSVTVHLGEPMRDGRTDVRVDTVLAGRVASAVLSAEELEAFPGALLNVNIERDTHHILSFSSGMGGADWEYVDAVTSLPPGYVRAAYPPPEDPLEVSSEVYAQLCAVISDFVRQIAANEYVPLSSSFFETLNASLPAAMGPAA